MSQSGAPGELGDEFPLGELGGGVGDVARHVLQHEPSAEMVLHGQHALGHMVQRLLGVGQRQQVVHVLPAQAGEAEMVGDPERLHPFNERLEIVEVVSVERIDRADRQRHAMQRHRIVAADAVEPVQRAAARHHVVLRQSLEPAHLSGAGDDLFVVFGPKAQSEAEFVGAHVVESTLSRKCGRPRFLPRAAARISLWKKMRRS